MYAQQKAVEAREGASGSRLLGPNQLRLLRLETRVKLRENELEISHQLFRLVLELQFLRRHCSLPCFQHISGRRIGHAGM